MILTQLLILIFFLNSIKFNIPTSSKINIDIHFVFQLYLIHIKVLKFITD